MSLDVVVVKQTRGELPPFPVSRFHSPFTAADVLPNISRSGAHNKSEEALDNVEEVPIPACYLRIEEDVFFFDHTRISKIIFPPLSDLPKNVPPYIDMALGKDHHIFLRIWVSECISPTASRGKLHSFLSTFQSSLTSKIVYPTNILTNSSFLGPTKKSAPFTLSKARGVWCPSPSVGSGDISDSSPRRSSIIASQKLRMSSSQDQKSIGSDSNDTSINDGLIEKERAVDVGELKEVDETRKESKVVAASNHEEVVWRELSRQSSIESHNEPLMNTLAPPPPTQPNNNPTSSCSSTVPSVEATSSSFKAYSTSAQSFSRLGSISDIAKPSVAASTITSALHEGTILVGKENGLTLDNIRKQITYSQAEAENEDGQNNVHTSTCHGETRLTHQPESILEKKDKDKLDPTNAKQTEEVIVQNLGNLLPLSSTGGNFGNSDLNEEEELETGSFQLAQATPTPSSKYARQSASSSGLFSDEVLLRNGAKNRSSSNSCVPPFSITGVYRKREGTENNDKMKAKKIKTTQSEVTKNQLKNGIFEDDVNSDWIIRVINHFHRHFMSFLSGVKVISQPPGIVPLKEEMFQASSVLSQLTSSQNTPPFLKQGLPLNQTMPSSSSSAASGPPCRLWQTLLQPEGFSDEQNSSLLSYCINSFGSSVIPSPIADHVEQVLETRLEQCKVLVTKRLDALYSPVQKQPNQQQGGGGGGNIKSGGSVSKLKDGVWLEQMSLLRDMLAEQSEVYELLLRFKQLPRETPGAAYIPQVVNRRE